MKDGLVATIDVGTNTALLLISGYEDGKLKIEHNETRFVRLGEGVDAAGQINEHAIRRLCDALAHFKDVASKSSVAAIVVGATSASRDAANKQAVMDAVYRETGLQYEILTGDEEALLSFRGALSGLEHGSERTYLVLDIGGGSTEFVRGTINAGKGVIEHAVSLNIGSVRLTERFFDGLPPGPTEISNARDWLGKQLQVLPDVWPDSLVLVGASGTTRALFTLQFGRKPATEDLQVPGICLTRSMIHEWADRLLGMSNEEVLALNPVVMDGRSDVFTAGVLILESIIQRSGISELFVSSRGLRHGLALQYWQDAD